MKGKAVSVLTGQWQRVYEKRNRNYFVLAILRDKALAEEIRFQAEMHFGGLSRESFHVTETGDVTDTRYEVRWRWESIMPEEKRFLVVIGFANGYRRGHRAGCRKNSEAAPKL